MAEKKILKRPLTADEVSYFCYQLLQVLDSGVPVSVSYTHLTLPTICSV